MFRHEGLDHHYYYYYCCSPLHLIHPSPTYAMAFSSLIIFFLLLFFYTLQLHPMTSLIITSFNTSSSPWTPLSNLTLLSPNSTFAAGFLPAASSPGLYLFSVWFLSDPSRAPVWSHGPDKPLAQSATLSISSSSAGLLSLTNSTTTTSSSSSPNLFPGAPSSSGGSLNSSLTLSESGELSYGRWTSFSHPTDTILPGQPLDFTLPELLVSGDFSLLNTSSLAFRSSDVYWSPKDDRFKTQNFTDDGILLGRGEGNKLIASDYGDRRHRRLTLAADGNLRVYSLDPGSSDGPWRVTWRAIQEICTVRGLCAANSFCVPANMSDADVYTCECLEGFEKGPNKDCVRRVPLRREPSADTFVRMDYVNFTGGGNQTDRKTPTFAACRSDCLNNQDCLGFAYKFDGSQYCVHQIGSLRNGYWSPATGVAFFLKVDRSEAGPTNYTSMMTTADTACPIIGGLQVPPKEYASGRRTLAMTGALFTLELLIGALSFWALLRKFIKYRDMARVGMELVPSGGPKRFSYAELKTATTNFSDMVGSGGCGVVYRGKLSDGRVVAVKRLKDVDPGGGEADFWAEVTIIARMHHLNLVRLWGFCAEKGERILVYEYVANGSLAKFIFFKPTQEPNLNEADDEKPILDWDIRYRIAMGVARAIAYLHEECLEWVLHCDIKPENILLEDDFRPKVSDFGLAKLAKNKKDVVSMSRIRGTRGYLAPEWVKDEPITPKADVYSYGMVLLELVSGTRNFDYTMASELDSADWYFPKWAYEKMYIEKKVEDILDRRIVNRYDDRVHYPMIDRMVKTAMWCLQDRPETRPSMGKVTKMLEGTVEILEPGRPTIFYLGEGDPLSESKAL